MVYLLNKDKKQKKTMKKIVRLTESDLARIVKRVINEEANALADKILSEMEYLCNKGDAESDAMVAAVKKIKDKALTTEKL